MNNSIISRSTVLLIRSIALSITVIRNELMFKFIKKHFLAIFNCRSSGSITSNHLSIFKAKCFDLNNKWVKYTGIPTLQFDDCSLWSNINRKQTRKIQSNLGKSNPTHQYPIWQSTPHLWLPSRQIVSSKVLLHSFLPEYLLQLSNFNCELRYNFTELLL